MGGTSDKGNAQPHVVLGQVKWCLMEESKLNEAKIWTLSEQGVDVNN